MHYFNYVYASMCLLSLFVDEWREQQHETEKVEGHESMTIRVPLLYYTMTAISALVVKPNGEHGGPATVIRKK